MRSIGHAFVDKSYDHDVCDVAVPVFGPDDKIAIGALAVATPHHRMTEAIKSQIAAELTQTAKELLRGMGIRWPSLRSSGN